jgi:hypothetical protein
MKKKSIEDLVHSSIKRARLANADFCGLQHRFWGGYPRKVSKENMYSFRLKDLSFIEGLKIDLPPIHAANPAAAIEHATNRRCR